MKLHALQQAAADFLSADETLVKHNVKVLAENKGDILNQIDALVSQLGCMALVHAPGFVATGTDTAPPVGVATLVDRKSVV
jgi:hypothetical protein